MTLTKNMQTLHIDQSTGDNKGQQKSPQKRKTPNDSKQHSPGSSDSALVLDAAANYVVSDVAVPAPVALGGPPKYTRRQRRRSSTTNKKEGTAYDSANSSPSGNIQADADVQNFVADSAAQTSHLLLDPKPGGSPPPHINNLTASALDAHIARGRKFSGTWNAHNIPVSEMVFYDDDEFGPNCTNQAPPHKHPFKMHSSKTERKKRSHVVSLSVTKNGGGGRFTWGRPGDEWKTTCPSGVRDSKDPNFDDYLEDDNTIFEQYRRNYTDADICEALHGTFKEYIVNGDDREALDVIALMQSNQVNLNVISRIFFHLFLWGLEAKKAHRGHVWSLNSKILSRKDVRRGDESVLTALSNFFDARVELAIDCPDYDEYLQKLVACFMYKFAGSGCFEKFIDEQIKKRGRASFTESMKVSRSIATRLKSDTEIMQTLWTVDDYLTTEELTLALSRLVDDWENAGYGHICLGDDLASNFKTPHFYHQLVYLLLTKAVSSGTYECLSFLIQALQYLVFDRDLVTLEQVRVGFRRFYRDMDDLAVDIPSVHMLMGMIVKVCYREKLIDDKTRVNVPTRKLDRRRIRSEHSKF